MSPHRNDQLAPMPRDTTGHFVTTNSVVLAVSLHVPHLPERGASIRASSATSLPGGGFITLSAAAAQGVSTNLAAPLGTGPNSSSVRRLLHSEGIHTLTDVLVGDIGVAMTMVERDGHNTTVVTAGVESEPTLAGLEAVPLQPGDLVHISGYDLSSTAASVLTKWGAELPDFVTLVLAVSPAVEDVSAETWMPLLKRADIVTMNIREASALTAILDSASPGTGIRDLLRPDSAIVRRLGVMGCEVQLNRGSRNQQIPAYRAQRIDTTGVGDTHVASMCAGLLHGLDLVSACRRANAAAALMVSRKTTQPPPTPDEIDRVMELGVV